MNANGFALAGQSVSAEAFTPKTAELTAATYNLDTLASLTYQTIDGLSKNLTIQEVLQRADGCELKAPFILFTEPEEADFRIPAG